MPTKKYKLPEKLANLPATNLEDVMKNPHDYGLTMREFLEFMEYMAKTYAPFAPNNSNSSNNEIDKLKAENADLKIKNSELREALDKYKYKYERVMDLIDDIITEMVEDEEDD